MNDEWTRAWKTGKGSTNGRFFFSCRRAFARFVAKKTPRTAVLVAVRPESPRAVGVLQIRKETPTILFTAVSPMLMDVCMMDDVMTTRSNGVAAGSMVVWGLS